MRSKRVLWFMEALASDRLASWTLDGRAAEESSIRDWHRHYDVLELQEHRYLVKTREESPRYFLEWWVPAGENPNDG